jgi:hypothetical protein
LAKAPIAFHGRYYILSFGRTCIIERRLIWEPFAKINHAADFQVSPPADTGDHVSFPGLTVDHVSPPSLTTLHASPSFSLSADAVIDNVAVADAPATRAQEPLAVMAKDALPLPSKTVTQEADAVSAIDALPLIASTTS